MFNFFRKKIQLPKPQTLEEQLHELIDMYGSSVESSYLFPTAPHSENFVMYYIELAYNTYLRIQTGDQGYFIGQLEYENPYAQFHKEVNLKQAVEALRKFT